LQVVLDGKNKVVISEIFIMNYVSQIGSKFMGFAFTQKLG